MSAPLLLDTCAIVWMASTPGRFSEKARDAIENADSLLYSPISAWEIALKHPSGIWPFRCRRANGSPAWCLTTAWSGYP